MTTLLPGIIILILSSSQMCSIVCLFSVDVILSFSSCVLYSVMFLRSYKMSCSVCINPEGEIPHSRILRAAMELNNN